MTPSADEPVWVVDLTDEGLAECERDLARLDGTDVREPPERALPAAPDEPIRSLAILVSGEAEPVVLALEPTTDVAYLDALGRLLRVAVVLGERLPTVAVRYGAELERRLAFERRLPRWAYEGLAPELAGGLPAKLRRVLG